MRGDGEQHSHDADISSGTATTSMLALVKDLFRHTWKSEFSDLTAFVYMMILPVFFTHIFGSSSVR